MESVRRNNTLEERVDEFFKECRVGDPRLIALNYVVQLAQAQTQYGQALDHLNSHKTSTNELLIRLTNFRQVEAKLAIFSVLHQERLVSMPGYKKAFNQINEFDNEQFRRADGVMQTNVANKFWSTRLETILEKVE